MAPVILTFYALVTRFPRSHLISYTRVLLDHARVFTEPGKSIAHCRHKRLVFKLNSLVLILWRFDLILN